MGLYAKPPLKNASILITGASSGIGREMALQLAKTARTMILVARRVSELEKLKDQLVALNPNLRVALKPLDLSDHDSLHRMTADIDAEFGHVDILINNAGMGDYGFFERSDWRKINMMLQLNITALTYLTRKLLPPMIRQGRGGIMNVSSGFGLNFAPEYAAYIGTKHYVTGFTEALRAELAGTGVALSQVCPGPVTTEFGAVASDGKGIDAPSALFLSAEDCARFALRDFARGKPLIIPGLRAKLLIWFGVLVPRPLRRFLFGFVSRKRRPAQSAAAE
jgi:short-subunit dehydrogenase